MKLLLLAVLLEIALAVLRGSQALEGESLYDKKDYTLQYLNTELSEINLAAQKSLEVFNMQREKLINARDQEIKQQEKVIANELAEKDKKLHERENEVIKKEVLIEVMNRQNEKFRLEELKAIQQQNYQEKLAYIKEKEDEVKKSEAEAKQMHEKIIQAQYTMAEYEGQLNRRKTELDEKEAYLIELQKSLNLQQGKLEQKQEEIDDRVKTEIEQEKNRLAMIQEKQKELDKHREDLILLWHSVIDSMEDQQAQVRNKEELNAIENIQKKISIGLEELEASRTKAESFLKAVDINSKSLEEKLREFQLPN